MTVDELNALPADPVRDALRSCCGATRWVDGMLGRRPFQSVAGVLDAADDIWSTLGPDDWHEAFAHHPRIGDKRRVAAQSTQAANWSAKEQASVSDANAALQDELAAMNRAYEQRFGHMYIVCAAGKTAAELLDIARRRLDNDPTTELGIAADEQHKITRLRLRKLLAEST